MKHSIRFKLALLLVILMFMTISLTTVFSHTIMQNYFEYLMQRSLVNTFGALEQELQDDSTEQQIKLALSSASAKANDASMLVIDKNTGMSYTTANEEGRMKDSLYLLANLILRQEGMDSDAAEKNHEKQNGMAVNYIIQQNHDNRLNADYYDLVGQIGNRYYVSVRRSVSFVDESVDAATHVFTLVGIMMTLLGSIAMLVVASRFTKPIHDMAQVAVKMQELDFNAKVEVNSRDEISALGNAMNELSFRLEKTISELKSANMELSEDILKKEEVDEMRKDFLAHVSHELKTPIALIQGYAEGLKENISDDQESRDFYCEVIMDEANKMNLMVKKLLSLNELEFGNNKLDISRFDIVALVNNILQSSTILLQDFDGKLQLESPAPIYVWADAYRISEVITNYLTNAIHYVSPHGTIRISYTLEDKQVKVAVYNTGEPLAAEELEKIWIKFYKVDKARTREYGGNGIGLSIVAATMEAHNKAYGVENVEGGIEFYFCLDTDTAC